MTHTLTRTCLGLLALWLCASPLAAQAQLASSSIENPVEHMLAANPALQEIDSNLQTAQRAFRDAASITAWRERVVGLCAGDVDCLLRAYLDELAHTQRILINRTEKQLATATAASAFDGGESRGGNLDPTSNGRATGSLLLPPSGVTKSPNGKSAEEIFAIASRSIVLVSAYGKRFKLLDRLIHGSGVTIAPQRVATNCHVVADMDRISVGYDGTTYPARLLVASPQTDICILQVDNLPSQPATLRALSDVRPGQRIYAIGNPLNIGLSISDGLLSAVVDEDRVPDIKINSRLIQFNAQTWQGNSGGGLFDDQGRVLGIPTLRWVVKDQAPMNFAVPLADVASVRQVVKGL